MLKPDELKTRMKGVVCVTVTPFTQSYGVDEAAISENVKFLVRKGIHVVVAGGSTGEFSSLSEQEFSKVVKAHVEAAGGKVPVLAGASHSGTHECIKLAKLAQQAGADGLLTVPPYYLKPSWEGTLLHYKMVAESVDIGISIYNNPGFSKVNLLPRQLKEMVEKIPTVVAVKETSGDLLQFDETLKAIGDKVPVLMGRELLAYYGMAGGAPGFVSSLANFAPEIALQLYDAFVQRDLAKAWTVKQRLEEYDLLQAEMLQKYAFPAQIPFAKAAMEMVGLKAGPPRPPMTGLNAEMKEKLRQSLVHMGVMGQVQNA